MENENIEPKMDFPKTDEEYIKTKKKIQFRDLIPPRVLKYPDYEQLLGIFKWMAESGEDYDGMIEALSGKPSCIHFTQIDPFTKNIFGEITRRFSIILNGRSIKEGVKQWKKDYNVNLNSSRIIHMLYQDRSAPDYTETKEIFEKIWDFKGKDFNKSPNSCHPDARTIKSVNFRVYNKAPYTKNKTDFRYRFEFRYSFHMNHSSYWRHDIISEQDELLSDFCLRVQKIMKEITE